MSSDLVLRATLDPRYLSAFADQVAFALDEHLRAPAVVQFPVDAFDRFLAALDRSLQQQLPLAESARAARLIGVNASTAVAGAPTARLVTQAARLRRLSLPARRDDSSRRLRVVLAAIAADLDGIDSARISEAKNRQHLAADPV